DCPADAPALPGDQDRQCLETVAGAARIIAPAANGQAAGTASVPAATPAAPGRWVWPGNHSSPPAGSARDRLADCSLSGRLPEVPAGSRAAHEWFPARP